jgi:7,8-dihydroneopterin aldolase/epimerase/oxygenase
VSAPVDNRPHPCHRRAQETVMPDSLILELADFEHLVHTGIYSEETGQPQPLRFTVHARLKAVPHYDPDTSLDASKNYMDLKFACSAALGDRHFKLIEAVADHVCETLFLQDSRVEAVTVKIVKLALSEADEKIGITLHRERR